MLIKLVQLKRITDEDLEAKLPAAGSYGGLRTKPPVVERFFVIFWAKNSAFNDVWITFCTFSDPFERTKLLRFESQLKKSLTSGQDQNTLKILQFGVQFCK